MEYLFIYGLQLADLLNAVSSICGLILIVIVVALVPTFMCKDEDPCFAKKGFGVLCKIGVTLLVLLVLSALAPTKQTLLLMGGTYYGKKAANAVVTSDKLQKVNTIIDLQLDKYIKDLTKEVNHE